MRYWLMKSEPDDCSIDDLAAMPEQTVPWYGVRNYQARNLMRNQMVQGDAVLFYHSSCAEPGIAGLARVASDALPGCHPVRFQQPLFRSRRQTGRATVVQRGRALRAQNPLRPAN